MLTLALAWLMLIQTGFSLFSPAVLYSVAEFTAL